MKQNAMRLAFRKEGNFWVAYLAPAFTMEGATPLGSIAMCIIEDPARKQAFMDLMRSGLSDIFADLGMPVSKWNDPEPAPECERAGRA